MVVIACDITGVVIFDLSFVTVDVPDALGRLLGRPLGKLDVETPQMKSGRKLAIEGGSDEDMIEPREF